MAVWGILWAKTRGLLGLAGPQAYNTVLSLYVGSADWTRILPLAMASPLPKPEVSMQWEMFLKTDFLVKILFTSLLVPFLLFCIYWQILVVYISGVQYGISAQIHTMETGRKVHSQSIIIWRGYLEWECTFLPGCPDPMTQIITKKLY